MGLIIFSIIQFFLIVVAGAVAVWQILRFRKKAADSKAETEAFKTLLHQYEDEKYQRLGLEKKKAGKGKLEGVAE